MRNDLSSYVNGPLDRIASGFFFAEGPVWNPAGFLLFSDMPGDVRRRWSPLEGVTVVKQPANKCNGMAYDDRGRLLVCEHSTSRLVRERDSGNPEVLAQHFQGSELNSPNDVVVTFEGDIFFTDPTYGRTPDFGLERSPVLDFRGLYRLTSAGDLTLIDTEFIQPNGLCFSPDESILYVNDTERAMVVAYPRQPDGSLGPRSVFADGIGEVQFDIGVVDGMKCDAEGNVLVTGPDGIWVFDPAGNQLGIIEVPEVAGNLNWGGSGWTTLYIAASTSIYRIEATVSGAPVPNMRRLENGGGEDD
jgi:gluconolactonase